MHRLLHWLTHCQQATNLTFLLIFKYALLHRSSRRLCSASSFLCLLSFCILVTRDWKWCVMTFFLSCSPESPHPWHWQCALHSDHFATKADQQALWYVCLLLLIRVSGGVPSYPLLGEGRAGGYWYCHRCTAQILQMLLETPLNGKTLFFKCITSTTGLCLGAKVA